MEENKLNYDEITELMGKISKSMELSRKKQSDIDKKNEKLYKQTKILVVEDGKEEIEKLKQDKEEFDEMTVNSLVYSKEQVLIIKDELEQEFQQKLLDTMKKQKEIEGKLKSMLSRDLSDEKRAQVQESADKSANKLKEDMQAFQKQYFEKKAKLEEFDRGIESYALELGAEDRLKGISLSSIKKAREEASNLDKKDPKMQGENKKTNVEETKTEEYKPNLESAQEKFEDLKNKYISMQNDIRQNENKQDKEKGTDTKIIPQEVDKGRDSEGSEVSSEKEENKTLNVDDEISNSGNSGLVDELQADANILGITINERMNVIFATVKNKESELPSIPISYDLKEALKEKKQLFKNNKVNAYCKKLCGNNGIKGHLLARRVNPAVIKALEDNKEMQEIYIQCLKDKKELPFEMTHDLRDSKLGFFDRMSMRICAKAENKIPGTKVTFAERFWNKNKALPDAEKPNTTDERSSSEDEIVDGKYVQVEQDKEKTVQERVKVENKDNRIEEEAKRLMEEAEAQRAEDVKNMMNENKNKGR